MNLPIFFGKLERRLTDIDFFSAWPYYMQSFIKVRTVGDKITKGMINKYKYIEYQKRRPDRIGQEKSYAGT